MIAYDHRDTGRSTWAFDARPYAIRDLADDALAVLDAFGVERAHIVGMSMGGVLVQLLLADHPERLLSATVFCTAALGSGLAAGCDDRPTSCPVPTRISSRCGRRWERHEMRTPSSRGASSTGGCSTVTASPSSRTCGGASRSRSSSTADASSRRPPTPAPTSPASSAAPNWPRSGAHPGGRGAGRPDQPTTARDPPGGHDRELASGDDPRDGPRPAPGDPRSAGDRDPHPRPRRR